jgi:hypothetical protein
MSCDHDQATFTYGKVYENQGSAIRSSQLRAPIPSPHSRHSKEGEATGEQLRALEKLLETSLQFRRYLIASCW